MAHLPLSIGSAFWWSAVYLLVCSSSPQVLVRSLIVGRSAGSQVRILPIPDLNVVAL